MADTKQQQAILRQSATARKVRRKFGAGTRVRVIVSQATGTVLRHVPSLDSQGGHLTVEWDSGTVGRITPINLEVE